MRKKQRPVGILLPPVSIPADLFEKLKTDSAILTELLSIFNWPYNRDLILTDAKKFVKYEDIIREKDKSLSEATKKAQELQIKLDCVTEEHEKLQKDHDGLQKTFTEQQTTIDKHTVQLTTIQTEMETLREQMKKPHKGLGKWLRDLFARR